MGLVTFVSRNDFDGFRTAAARLGVNDVNAALTEIGREFWSQFGLESQRRCAEAQLAHNLQERGRQYSYVAVAGRNLTINGVENAEVSMVAGIGQQIRQQGRARGMSDDQIQQQQEDMLLGAQQARDERGNALFSTGAIIGAASILGISMNKSQSGLRDPEENEAQSVFDAIRINAILISRDIMRRMNEIDRQLSGNLDTRTRQQKEEEMADLSRQLTRLTGSDSRLDDDKQVRSDISYHMTALNALHANPPELDQITLSRRQPPQQAG